MEQLSMFDCLYEKFKINKPIKLIEAFSGYGSQNLALKYLGANYEHHRIIEWATKSIQAYNDIHVRDYKNYSEPLTYEEVVSYLFEKGISNNYSTPMTYDQIKRKGEKWCRNTFNNIIATRNLVNIQKVSAYDLDITDTENYIYLLTYSFPCQDLSLAGKGKGMSKGSGTRSGMLWEVERLLEECVELKKLDKGNLPTFLLMENVPQVVGANSIKDFQDWVTKLESLGYFNFVEILNAKDFGIPQNRERCFMISILGEYNYSFPKKIPLKLRLKDMLEEEVDEKYYLSKQMIEGMMNTKFESYKLENKLLDTKGIANCIIARFEGAPQCIQIPEATKKGYAEAYEGDGVYINRPHQKRGCVQKGLIQTLKTSCDDVGVVVKVGNYSPSGHNAFSIVSGEGIAPTVMENHGTVTAVVEEKNMKQQMCEHLIASGKVQEFDVIRHSYSSSRMNGDMKDIQQNNMSPTLDTRCDCLGVAIKNQNNLRIRKLTPRECWRLMGVKDEDYDNVCKNQSNSSLYHLAGDSIVVDVLMHILKQIL